MHQIGTVVSYCTNDFRFLTMCIEEARHFSSQIIVVAADHLFDGTPEDQARLESACLRHPDCLFIEFSYDPVQPYGLYCPVTSEDPEWVRYWHSTGRYIGFHFLDPKIETVLFADVDEVHEGKRFIEWLDGFDYRSFDAIRLASYFYFRSASHRALSWLPSSLLVKRSALAPETILDLLERQGMLEGMAGTRMRQAVGLDGQPLVHHYSWVKTKEEMLVKAKSWGHKHDKDWEGLIEEEFSAPFRGKDTFYGLHYEEVSPWKDPLAAIPFSPHQGAPPENLLRLDAKSFFRHTLL